MYFLSKVCTNVLVIMCVCTKFEFCIKSICNRFIPSLMVFNCSVLTFEILHNRYKSKTIKPAIEFFHKRCYTGVEIGQVSFVTGKWKLKIKECFSINFSHWNCLQISCGSVHTIVDVLEYNNVWVLKSTEKSIMVSAFYIGFFSQWAFLYSISIILW